MTRLAALILLFALAAVPTARAQASAEGARLFELELERFGVGGAARPGDWAGLRFAVRDLGAEVRRVVLRVSIPDADGDETRWERLVTTNPGSRQGVWTYARLPFTTRVGEAIRVSIHETDESGVAGRELASTAIGPTRLVPAESPLIGLIGRAAAGLDRYQVPIEPGAAEPATGHQWIELATVDPEQLGSGMPDAWMGLAPMRAIVWTEGAPSRLRAAGAEALGAWVRRGGHLVVVVPPDASGWESELDGRLRDLLPEVEITRREDVNLADYRPILTPDGSAPLPARAVIHELPPGPDADEQDAMPILAGPGGRPVVTRRLLGAGAVTMVGIGVAERGVAAWLDPQRFWHRVLGERFDVLSSAEMEALASADPPANFRSRSEVWADDAVGALINKTGRAGAGVLLGLGVFSAYWLVAGPGGYAVLRWTGRARHSWAIFVGVAAVFTAIAWGGAAALRPVRVEVSHLTFVDHVFGQDLYRTRSWLGALLPSYGQAEVSIEPSPGRRHALTPWEPPESSGDSFPDPRPYTIDARRPESMVVPSRATVKSFRADWLGAPPWRSVWPTEPIAVSGEGRLTGALEHGLPAALRDVVIVLVYRQEVFTDPPPGGLQARTLAWRLTGAWEAGDPLDLAPLTAASGPGRSVAPTRGDAYLDRITSDARSWLRVIGAEDRRTALDKLETLTWGPVLGQPRYTRPPSATGFPLMIHSRVGHGLDLARWFTQPCLIVTGRAETPLPAPVRVDGAEPPSAGQTMLRWVYPLPPNPPEPVEQGP